MDQDTGENYTGVRNHVVSREYPAGTHMDFAVPVFGNHAQAKNIGYQCGDANTIHEQGYDPMGCFCYASPALEDALDFNRSGEPDVGFQFPEWVVRSSVRELFQEYKLKGWAFEPILELGTQSYEEYNELWSSFYGLLAQCEKHTVRGRYP